VACAACRTGSNFWPIFMIVNGQLLPHFSIEYRKHFTNFHATVVETAGGIQIGATEACSLMMICQFVWLFFSDTNTNAATLITPAKLGCPHDFGPLGVTVGTLVTFNTFVLSIQYNIGNFYEGYTNAKDKAYAIQCILPFFYILSIIFFAS
jgi:hypothetical protein